MLRFADFTLVSHGTPDLYKKHVKTISGSFVEINGAESNGNMIMTKFLILIMVMVFMISPLSAETDCDTVNALENSWRLCPATFKDCLQKLKDEYGKAYNIQFNICRWCAAVDICRNTQEGGNSRRRGDSLLEYT
uniref:Uncharacterized protein n=1 Tax=Glossina brevipalpis TaxID=37001 RepID=A0A1A9WUJ4_9MUSC